MTRVTWWLAYAVSRMLEPGERDAVLGDIAESGESGGQALGDLLGLVVRRQAGLWKDWRPWLAMLGLALPFGMRLGLQSGSLGRSYDLYLWMIGNYGAIDPGILHGTGLSVRSGVAGLACGSFLLAGWAWSSGFVLGSLSRRAIWVNGALFCLLLLSGALLGTPKYRYYVNGEEYSQVTWYGVLLPLTLFTVLVLLPALWGMRQGFRRTTPPLVQTLLWVAAIATITVVMTPRWGWWWDWPLGYMAATASWRRWRGEAARD